MTKPRSPGNFRLQALLLAGALCAPAAAIGAEPAAQLSHAGCAASGDPVDPALLERPVVPAEGIGRVEQRVTTSSPEAQAFHDQGLTYLHHYTFLEAARAFHQAIRLDGDCAMCWMGLARAQQGLERPEAAAAAIARAQALAPKVSERERRFISLRALQIAAEDAPEGRAAERHAALKAELDRALAADPGDAELWVLRGNAEEGGAWGRGQFGGAASIAFYEAALQRRPGHLGARHYLVHSFENIGHHAEAAEHAKIYAAAAPRVAHAQHMYGHVLPRLGRWREALEQFQKADAVEVAYARSVGLRPGDDWHHMHNLQLLGYTYLRLGRLDEAEDAFRRAFDTPARLGYRGTAQVSLAELYLWRGRADDALGVARALQAETRTPAAHVAGAAVEGEALLALGRAEEARATLRRAGERLEKARGELGQQARYLDYFARPYVDQLRAGLELRGEKPDAAEASILAMADELARNPRFDAWGEGLFRLERIAADARRAGRAGLAAAIVERMRRIDPGYVPGAAGGR